MEIFMVVMLCLAVVGGGLGGALYAADPRGWNSTFKRLSTLTRASLESSKPVKVLEAKKEDKTVSEWDASFAMAEMGDHARTDPEEFTRYVWDKIVASEPVTDNEWKVARSFLDKGQQDMGDLMRKRVVRQSPDVNGSGKGNYAAMELSPAMAADKRRETSWHEMIRRAGESVKEAQVKANLPVPAPVLKHEIVKKDFYRTHLGLWPQWTCKCGVKQYQPLGSGTLESAQGRADSTANDHVRSMNESEKRKEETGGRFAW